jgi:hypothetical protein
MKLEIDAAPRQPKPTFPIPGNTAEARAAAFFAMVDTAWRATGHGATLAWLRQWLAAAPKRRSNVRLEVDCRPAELPVIP